MMRIATTLVMAASLHLALSPSLGLAGQERPPASAHARAETVSPEIVRNVAPTGRLRAAINVGNAVLAQRGDAGELRGISVDLARALASRLGLSVDLVAFESAGQVSDTAGQNVWDVAFLAIDPLRAEAIAFTPAYVLIEGTYAVSQDSPLKTIDEVDRPGVQIAVGRGSAYDLFLTRKIKNASLVRTTTSADAIRLFVENRLDAVAGVKQPLVQFARETPGYRVMDGRFMAIEQAMGIPKGRDLAAQYLKAFVEDVKTSGFLAEALERHHQPDAVVAAPAAGR